MMTILGIAGMLVWCCIVGRGYRASVPRKRDLNKLGDHLMKERG